MLESTRARVGHRRVVMDELFFPCLLNQNTHIVQVDLHCSFMFAPNSIDFNIKFTTNNSTLKLNKTVNEYSNDRYNLRRNSLLAKRVLI